MNTLLIFIWIWAAMVAAGIWESTLEGRKAFAKGKHGWKIIIKGYVRMTKYHFFLFIIMFPLLITLPLVIYGWDTKLFGILMSAYFSGMSIQDFSWYLFNPKVKIREFWGEFSNYFSWITINNIKIIPWGYFYSWLIAILSWYFLWK